MAASVAAVSPVTYGLGFVFAALSGIAVAVQSGINATLGAHTGQAFASVISFATGLASCLLFFAIDVTALGSPLPTLPAMRGAPWWSWLGGPLGAFFIISLIVFAPRIGAGNVIAVFVCLQIASAVTLDLIGAVGYVRRTFSWPRWVGVALMGAGVALITRFPGEPVDKGPVLGTGARTPVGRALTHLFTRLPQFATAVSAAEGAGAGEVVLGPLPSGQHNHRA